MKKLEAADLYSLEEYSRRRAQMRADVIEHKRRRRLALGEAVNLYFEDRLTMQYQVQEMLRAERIFEAEGIRDELDAYNPLIPDGNNWKATMMIEVPDVDERRRTLRQLIGIEDRVYVQVGEYERVYAIADEDLDRSTEDKTSSVHFLRFELSDAMAAGLRNGASLAAGVDHRHYDVRVEPVPPVLHDALLNDLN
ncbi:MAG: DUF3501 family protein [Gammaproteobacteria bacterium]|nr:DUF3501 family protein [Gammaproteobacteria bacterium]